MRFIERELQSFPSREQPHSALKMVTNALMNAAIVG
jgi:hypothetical protein